MLYCSQRIYEQKMKESDLRPTVVECCLCNKSLHEVHYTYFVCPDKKHGTNHADSLTLDVHCECKHCCLCYDQEDGEPDAVMVDINYGAICRSCAKIHTIGGLRINGDAGGWAAYHFCPLCGWTKKKEN